MTFTCESAIMAKALRDIAAIAPRGHAIEILSNVLVEAADGQVRVTTTNMEMMATRTFAANVESAVSFTVDAARFSAVMGSLPNGSQVKLSLGERLVVTSGRSRFQFGVLPVTHFPPMPFDDEDAASFDAGDDLFGAMRTVRHASSTQETRVALNGVCLHSEASSLTVVATDSDRLAMVALPNSTGAIFKVTLPNALADMVIKLREASDCAVMVQIGEKSARFDFGDTMLTGRLIDIPFPDYRRVIPTSSLRTVKLYAVALFDALKRVALVTDEKSRRVYIDVQADKVTLANSGRDEGTEEIAASVNGEPISIWFNNQYLRDAITAIGADEIDIAIGDERGPVKITADANPSAKLIVMPQFG